ncbi:MAG: transposase [Bacteroidales bacterium]|nr:transposase [Bacteroidales bacterium]
MGKFTKIPSEIRNFFSEKRRASVMEAFTKAVESMSVDNKSLGGVKRDNCQLTNLQIFQLLILLPFFAVKGFSHYPESVLSRMFGGKKDVFYSFMAKDNIDWRNIVCRTAVRLIQKIVIRSDYRKSHLPTVLIADDSDLPKTGIRMESIGKIFSHVHQKCILGYKALMLCWSDGKTQFMIDASLHGEKGKIEGKEQGLTASQRSRRYQRERDENSHIAMRKGEYFMGKGAKLMEMVKRAIKSKVPFDYLLVDSWFTNTGLIDFVCHCKKKFHLLGMAKMSNTKYKTTEYGEANAKQLVEKLTRKKKVRYSRRYRCHYACVDAMLGDRNVRLFFCRRGRREGWKILLTTNLDLDFMRAYEIYSMRWSIEVFFSDAKRLLDLSGCSARDFSSQIAHVSLVMIRYNLLSSIKRSLDYETIGGLFGDVYAGVHELTVVEKIWVIILEVVAIVAELTGADEDDLVLQIIENDKRLAALKAYAQTA